MFIRSAEPHFCWQKTMWCELYIPKQAYLSFFTQYWSFNETPVFQDMLWSEILSKLPLGNKPYFIIPLEMGTFPGESIP